MPALDKPMWFARKLLCPVDEDGFMEEERLRCSAGSEVTVGLNSVLEEPDTAWETTELLADEGDSDFCCCSAEDNEDA